MRVLLGSGGIGTEERRKLCMDEMSRVFEGVSQVLFIPYASNDHDSYLEGANRFTSSAPFDLVGIHDAEDELDAIKEAEGIYVGGGNSFLLVRDLHEKGLVDAIRDKVSDGTPYVGISAGSNVACPTMMTTNDMPVVLPSSFHGFGIVPFQINPHYHPGSILWKEGDEIIHLLVHGPQAQGQAAVDPTVEAHWNDFMNRAFVMLGPARFDEIQLINGLLQQGEIDGPTLFARTRYVMGREFEGLHAELVGLYKQMGHKLT